MAATLSAVALALTISLVDCGSNSSTREKADPVPSNSRRDVASGALAAQPQVANRVTSSMDPGDRKLVMVVMASLPPAQRQYVAWIRVPPGKPGYEELPRRGLIVMFYKHVGGAHYVLFYDGHPQSASCAVYDPNLDSYLVAVPTCFKFQDANY